MKRSLPLILMLMFVLVLSACGAKDSKEPEKSTGGNDAKETEVQDEVTINTNHGSVTVNKNPEKVVVFDFGALDTMDKLGVNVAALPQMNVPKYLDKYADKEKYENVGSLKEPDFEKIHSLKPDLIIISGRQAELYDQFAEIAPTIDLSLDTSKYMESFKENATTIGKIFDKEDEVKKQLASVDEKIDALHEKASNLDEKALIVLANEGKVSAYGTKSRFGIIHDVFGFTPVDPDIEVSTHGQSVSFEYILEKNPDYLFVIDRTAAVEGKSTAKSAVENELVQKTNAYKNGKIIYLDPDYWYLSGGGLESVPAMVDEVEAAIK